MSKKPPFKIEVVAESWPEAKREELEENLGTVAAYLRSQGWEARRIQSFIGRMIRAIYRMKDLELGTPRMKEVVAGVVLAPDMEAALGILEEVLQ